MLTATEYGAGSLRNAPFGSLLLPRTKYEAPFLVGGSTAERVAICLGKDFRFQAFECGEADAWKGMLVYGVSIEVDEGSVFSPENNRTPPGAVIRSADQLGVAAQLGDRFNRFQSSLIPLVTGLSHCEEGNSVGFLQWRVVVGGELNKRTLMDISLVAQNNE